MSSTARPHINIVEVRAADLRDDDVILLTRDERPGRWRQVLDVHRGDDSILAMHNEEEAAKILRQSERVRLDTHRDGIPATGPASRPGRHPSIIQPDHVVVDVYRDRPSRDHVHTEALVHALLTTSEYVAVRFLREETSDGSEVDDGWAIFQTFAPVSVQHTTEEDIRTTHDEPDSTNLGGALNARLRLLGDAFPSLKLPAGEPEPPQQMQLMISRLIEAYESHDGDLDGFIGAWGEYLTGQDKPCPETANGIHRVTDGSCNECGAKNRS